MATIPPSDDLREVFETVLAEWRKNPDRDDSTEIAIPRYKVQHPDSDDIPRTESEINLEILGLQRQKAQLDRERDISEAEYLSKANYIGMAIRYRLGLKLGLVQRSQAKAKKGGSKGRATQSEVSAEKGAQCVELAANIATARKKLGARRLKQWEMAGRIIADNPNIGAACSTIEGYLSKAKSKWKI